MMGQSQFEDLMYGGQIVSRGRSTFFDIYCNDKFNKTLHMKKHISFTSPLAEYEGLKTYCITLKRSTISFVVHFDKYSGQATIGNLNIDLDHSYESNLRRKHGDFFDYDIPKEILMFLVELCRMDIRDKIDRALHGEFISVDKSHFALANAIDLMNDEKYKAHQEMREFESMTNVVNMAIKNKRRI